MLARSAGGTRESGAVRYLSQLHEAGRRAGEGLEAVGQQCVNAVTSIGEACSTRAHLFLRERRRVTLLRPLSTKITSSR